MIKHLIEWLTVYGHKDPMGFALWSFMGGLAFGSLLGWLEKFTEPKKTKDATWLRSIGGRFYSSGSHREDEHP